MLMPGSGRAPWVTGKGGWIIFTPLSTGGVELLRDDKANFFNCFFFFLYILLEMTNIYGVRGGEYGVRGGGFGGGESWVIWLHLVRLC